jgi:hypothetical protein
VPSFSLAPVGEEFLESAPTQLRAVFYIPRTAAAVWAELTGDQPLHWCRMIKSVTWTTPRPFGVGTRCTVHALAGTNVLDEYYFRWDDGHRHSFYAERSNTPMFKRFAEDHLVEPTSPTSCRFEWTIALEGRGKRLTTPANRLLLGTLFRDTRRHYGI